ncbi:MAG: hypothetical protein MZV70_33630 [Desulfobacterales bacterium]|nr:hypothetical protein [Desulfobacterales bacterium]
MNTLAIRYHLHITNQIGLVYTGMEHTLQNLLCLVLLLKVIDQSSMGAVQGILVLAIIALPLVRFEGLALSISACVVAYDARETASRSSAPGGGNSSVAWRMLPLPFIHWDFLLSHHPSPW